MTTLRAALLGLVALTMIPMILSAEEKKATPVVHNVFFTLKEASPESVLQLTNACKKYLTEHPGTVYFAAGPREVSFDRPVNDQDFHVALLIVFKDRESHDKYQVAARHKKFIEENKENWAKVRVFDSLNAK